MRAAKDGFFSLGVKRVTIDTHRNAQIKVHSSSLIGGSSLLSLLRLEHCKASERSAADPGSEAAFVQLPSTATSRD
jgi:hypothetical protein